MRSFVGSALACSALGAALGTAALTPHAQAAPPPVQLSTFPTVSGTGSVRGDTFGTHYENAYDHLSMDFGNFVNFFVPPGTFPTARIRGSGNTGGGIGTPAICIGTASLDVGPDGSDPANLLRMSGSTSAFGNLPATGPGEGGFTGMNGLITLDFAVLAPVYGVWGGTSNSKLMFNGTQLPVVDGGAVFLAPGSYQLIAQYAATGSVAPNTPGGGGASGNSSFSLLVGIPAPGAAVTPLLAAVFAARRRRR